MEWLDRLLGKKKTTSPSPLPLSKVAGGGPLNDYKAGKAHYDAKRFQEALPLLRRAAEGGIGPAQALLGLMHANGSGFAKDEVAAVGWYLKAADQNDAWAQFVLVDMYVNGRGVAKDEAAAARWCQRAAVQGRVDAQFVLGNMYMNGKGVVKNYAEALRWCRSAAEKQFAPAQIAVGAMHGAGWGVRKDYVEAARWYRMAAEQNYAPAQALLGDVYAAGQGVKRDLSVALYWYEAAASQNDETAKRSAQRLRGQGVVPRVESTADQSAATTGAITQETGNTIKIILERRLSLEPSVQVQAGTGLGTKGASPNLPTPDDISRIKRAVEYGSLSPDGTKVVMRREYDKALFVVDPNTNRNLSGFKLKALGCFQFIRSGKQIATISSSKRSVVLYDLESWQAVHQTHEAPGDVRRFAISPDGTLLAIGYDGGLLVCSLPDGSSIADKRLVGSGNCLLAWSRDSRMFAMVSNNEGSVWSCPDWAEVYRWTGPVKGGYQYQVTAAGFTADGALIAGDNLGYLRRIDVRGGTIHDVSAVEDAPILAISAAPFGPIVAAGRGNSFLQLWDIESGRPLASVAAHADSPGKYKWVEFIDWFPDGRRLCTWGGYEAKVWSVHSLP